MNLNKDLVSILGFATGYVFQGPLQDLSESRAEDGVIVGDENPAHDL
jgi:hypothetical protein